MRNIQNFVNSPRFIFWLVGGLFTLIGLGFLLIGTPLFLREYNLIEETIISTPAELEAAAPTATVLLEGELSEINRSVFERFVAYAVYEYWEDSEGDGSWREMERITPPLTIDSYNEAGGRRVRVQIVNDSYALNAPPHEHRPEEQVYEGAESYRGFQRGDKVLILGTVVALGETEEAGLSKGIEAAWIYGGSQSDYLSDQQAGFWIFGGLGAIFTVVGLILVVTGFVVKQ